MAINIDMSIENLPALYSVKGEAILPEGELMLCFLKKQQNIFPELYINSMLSNIVDVVIINSLF